MKCYLMNPHKIGYANKRYVHTVHRPPTHHHRHHRPPLPLYSLPSLPAPPPPPAPPTMMCTTNDDHDDNGRYWESGSTLDGIGMMSLATGRNHMLGIGSQRVGK